MAGEQKKKIYAIERRACKKFMDKLLGTLLCSLGPDVHEPKEKKRKKAAMGTYQVYCNRGITSYRQVLLDRGTEKLTH